MKTVRGMTLPELDDELAKTTGQFETLDELKEALKADLETRSKAEYEDEVLSRFDRQDQSRRNHQIPATGGGA
jgi:FKBP-type peptidyl-prolyl cis-trans isomerase (trigger factor)